MKYKINNGHGLAFMFGDTLVKPGVHEYDDLPHDVIQNIRSAGHSVELTKVEPARATAPVAVTKTDAPQKPVQGTSESTPPKPGPVTR
jgi:hypothetical protein